MACRCGNFNIDCVPNATLRRDDGSSSGHPLFSCAPTPQSFDVFNGGAGQTCFGTLSSVPKRFPARGKMADSAISRTIGTPARAGDRGDPCRRIASAARRPRGPPRATATPPRGHGPRQETGIAPAPRYPRSEGCGAGGRAGCCEEGRSGRRGSGVAAGLAVARTCMVTSLSSSITSLVRKSAPIVALYALLNFRFTNWFISEVLPTLRDGKSKAVRERASGRARCARVRTRVGRARVWGGVRRARGESARGPKYITAMRRRPPASPARAPPRGPATLRTRCHPG